MDSTSQEYMTVTHKSANSHLVFHFIWVCAALNKQAIALIFDYFEI